MNTLLNYKGTTPAGHHVFTSEDGHTVMSYLTMALALESFARTGRAFKL